VHLLRELRDMGAEVLVGNLLDLDSMHRTIGGCETMYFLMSVSDAYLAATVHAPAVAKYHGVKAFINMSQMMLSRNHREPAAEAALAREQALNWSGLPVVHARPTVLLEGFFLILTPDSVRESNHIRLPFGEGKTSPVAVEDVARDVGREDEAERMNQKALALKRINLFCMNKWRPCCSRTLEGI
jgi:uncharacterized protein YbjT (DUF2867 family)